MSKYLEKRFGAWCLSLNCPDPSGASPPFLQPNVQVPPGSQPATQLHTGETGAASSPSQLAQTGQYGVPVSTASQYGVPVSTASQPGALQTATDYSVHPLVLGPAYDRTDFNLMAVNKLDNKVSQ